MAPKGTIRRYGVLKWPKILSLQQSFLLPVDDSKQKQQNEYSNKGKKHINRSYCISMNEDEHLSGFFVKNSLESFCDATNLSASLFLFHSSDYDFRQISKIRLSQQDAWRGFTGNGKKSHK